jgi:restriction endonuclease S subunit
MFNGTTAQLENSSMETTPIGWKVFNLGGVLRELYRYPTYYNIKYIDSGVPEVRGELVLDDGTLDSRLELYRYVSEETAARFPRVRLASGDFVMTVRGTLGKVGIVPHRLENAVITANLIRLRFDQLLVEPRWAKHFLISPQFQNLLDAESSATTIKTIQAPTLEQISITLPPLPEQRHIAEILDTADEAMRQTERLIAKLKLVKAGLLHDLLTRGLDEHGRLRDPQVHPEQFKDSPLGRIPNDWEVKQLIDIASYQNGGPFPSDDYGDDGIPLLRPGNLPNDDIIRWDRAHTVYMPRKWATLTKNYIVRGNELVMNLTAQSLEDQFIGRVCMTPPDTFCLLNQRLARFVAKSCYLPFLFWTLKGPHFRKQIDRVSQGTKVQHIYDENLNRITLPVPTKESEQVAISGMLFAHSDRIRTEEAALGKLRQVKRGLMDDLLSGRVRVAIAEEEHSK